MAKQERPPRSLRGDSGPQYSRDWAAADAVLSQRAYALDEESWEEEEEEPQLEAQEMQMLDDLVSPEPKASSGRPGPVYAELPPLPVITPSEIPSSKATPGPEDKPKVQITRVNRPSIQRARRYNELQAEEEKKQREIAAETARRQAEVQPEMPSRTRGLTAGSGRTTELKSNIKEISDKFDETAENVKSTADSITQNIREIGDRVSSSVVEGVKKVSNRMVGLINRWGKKSSAAVQENDQDFEDEPLPSEQTRTAYPSQQEAPTAFSEKSKTEPSLLDQVPTVPPLPIAPLLREGMLFITFEKKPLPSERPQEESQLQAKFISEAMEDVRNCIKLVKKLPDPKEGPYKGIPLSYLFKHVREQDIYFFLHYIQAHPAAFKDKEFKFAEAFASWVLKRSHKTVMTDPFPEILPIAYFPLYKQNIRFLTVAKKSMVLATGKSPEEVNRLFLEAAIDDVKACVDFVAQFPPPEQGPYKGRPMRQIFRNIGERDIYFFLHYVQSQPEIFKNQNFKFSEAFASWLLKRSHETQLPRV
jgi:hypothetical protein